MSRDLLYKPPVPLVQPEEETKPGQKGKPKSPTAPHARELGSVGAEPERPAGAPAPSGKAPAFKAAYFNKDISGVRDVNLRQRNVAALRGAEGATDLKKIVLPPAHGVETPDPARLRGASDLMGLDGSFELSLESMLGRQSAWAKQPGITVELIMARLAQLEDLVAARRRALQKMLGRGRALATSVTVAQAVDKGGKALDDGEDVVSAGATLIERTAGQAEGMHMRLAKMLGIKRNK